MNLQFVPRLSFDFFPSRPVEVELSSSPLSSGAGLLPIRQFDERIRLTEQFAAALEDRRHPNFISNRCCLWFGNGFMGSSPTTRTKTTTTPCVDPIFKLIADRLPEDPDLSSQPTLSRFENAIKIPDLDRLRDVLVDLFIQSFDQPPRHLTLDIDAFDDPAHCEQQLIMFHGYYDQYQYLPIVITCAKTIWCS